MVQLHPTELFNELFPDRRDPDNPEHFLCRFCGKPTTNTRRRYYCSDECYWFCQKAVSWPWIRREVWERDDKKCVICGEPLRLDSDRGEGLYTMECHHRIYVQEIWRIAWDVMKSWSLEELRWKRAYYDNFKDEKDLERTARFRVFAVVYTLLFLNMNNLETLCPKCHDMKHSADKRNQNWRPGYSVAPTYWGKFWDDVDQMAKQKSLFDYMN